MPLFKVYNNASNEQFIISDGHRKYLKDMKKPPYLDMVEGQLMAYVPYLKPRRAKRKKTPKHKFQDVNNNVKYNNTQDVYNANTNPVNTNKEGYIYYVKSIDFNNRRSRNRNPFSSRKRYKPIRKYRSRSRDRYRYLTRNRSRYRGYSRKRIHKRKRTKAKNNFFRNDYNFTF